MNTQNNKPDGFGTAPPPPSIFISTQVSNFRYSLTAPQNNYPHVRQKSVSHLVGTFQYIKPRHVKKPLTKSEGSFRTQRDANRTLIKSILYFKLKKDWYAATFLEERFRRAYLLTSQMGIDWITGWKIDSPNGILADWGEPDGASRETQMVQLANGVQSRRNIESKAIVIYILNADTRTQYALYCALLNTQCAAVCSSRCR